MEITSITSGNASVFPAPDLESALASASAAHEKVATQADPAASKNKQQASGQQSVEDAAQALNDHMALVSINFKFSVDQDTHQIVVKVINQDTGKVIRQIPSEEALKIAKAIDILHGVIIQKKA